MVMRRKMKRKSREACPTLPLIFFFVKTEHLTTSNFQERFFHIYNELFIPNYFHEIICISLLQIFKNISFIL